WNALEAMCNLFRIAATQVAGHFQFEYPAGDDQRVTAHLKHVRRLPKDAPAIY
ncbi:MAG TPA: aminoglycoside 6-adenylyltransferase, partial [Anaerolineae bacterium]|nr:aminoglycoside 6-adenylyltransferase [Anaerolineae bacterium]